MNTIKKNKALIETLKSFARGIWFGLLGLVAVALAAVASNGAIAHNDINVYGFTLNYSALILAVVGYLAKMVDTYIHHDKNFDTKGIAPGFLQR